MRPHIYLVIPARRASTRLPDKVLAYIHGAPMILHTARRMANAGYQMCVATDDEAILHLVHKAGYAVHMTPKCASGTDRLAYLAEQLRWDGEDIVVNVQADEPLLPIALVHQVVALLQQAPDCAMSTLCKPIQDMTEFTDSSLVKVVMAQNRALYFSRAPIPMSRDQTPRILGYAHIGLYAYRVCALIDFAKHPQTPLECLENLEQLRVLESGGGIAIDEAVCPAPKGVDTPADLARMNALDKDAFWGLA